MEVASAQHGVIAHRQLIARGVSADGIKHRKARGRLHSVFRDVYAVGRPDLTDEGRWMAAVLACGDRALLSHSSAAAHWGFGARGETIEISTSRDVRRGGLRVHGRRRIQHNWRSEHLGIPVTTPTQTLIDLALQLSPAALERAINEAGKLDRIRWGALQVEVEEMESAPGVASLRAILARHTFTLTDSELERRFLPIARRVGLPRPLTQKWLDGFRVDFYWPDLGLVVETDGLRYHRTPATQTADACRDQTHLAAGRTPLRFTHSQVAYEPAYVEQTLKEVARRLLRRGPVGQGVSRPLNPPLA